MSSQLRRAVDAMQRGRMVIMVDDAHRENEGDLVMAAQFVNEEAIAFMASEGRGLICLPLEGDQVDRLALPMMPRRGLDPRNTAFTISIEASSGITTGISAADRAHTIRLASDPKTPPEALSTPGHIFPLRAHPAGCVARDGHTEGAIDLARLAGLAPSAVICEVMLENGRMARLPDLQKMSERFDLPIISIDEIVRWCRQHGRGPLTKSVEARDDRVHSKVEEVAEAALPSFYGGDDLRIHAYRADDGLDHIALVKGDPAQDVPIVRMHSECVTGDALASLRCDCGPQLHAALEMIKRSQSGVLLYLRGHEGRGIGLANKIRAYALQDRGRDTLDANLELGFPADARDWSVAVNILRSLGITKLKLLTNNPAKASALEKSGLLVQALVPLEVGRNPHNHAYLSTKKHRMGHRFSDAINVNNVHPMQDEVP